jgi:hypothetical protein
MNVVKKPVVSWARIPLGMLRFGSGISSATVVWSVVNLWVLRKMGYGISYDGCSRPVYRLRRLH